MPTEEIIAGPMSEPHSQWYVIHTRSRHEAKVEVRLQEIISEVFLPRIIIPSRRRDRKVLLNVPLFPGYLFIHTDLESSVYFDIFKIPGIVRILGLNGRFFPVPPETIESIRLIVASERPYYPNSYLKRGMWVRIIDGPLAGAIGILKEKLAKKRRLVVTVELFNRAVAVEIPDDSVEPWKS